MRIVGHIEHSKYKITILYMNNRYDIKIEFMGLEQHYKIRETDYFNSAQKIEKNLTEEFYNRVSSVFEQMISNRNLILSQDENDLGIDYLTGVI